MVEDSPTSMAALFFHSKVPQDRPALMVRKEDGVKIISRGALRCLVEEFATGLRILGIERSDRVAILLENRPEWLVADLAIAAIGAVSVPVYTTLGAEDLRFILEDSGSVAVVTQQRLLERLEEACKALSTVEKLIVVDGQDTGQGSIAFESVLGLGREELKRAPFRVEPVDRDELFSIVYTSGTTGRARGVMLSHGNLISNIHAISSAMHIGGEDRYLSYLPLSHIFERTTHHFVLHKGCPICYARGFSFVGADIEFFKPTFMIGVPFVFDRFKQKVEEGIERLPFLRRLVVKKAMEWARRGGLRRGLSSSVVASLRKKVAPTVKFFVSGGAPLSSSTAEFFFSIGLPIYEGYGLTETSPVVSVNTPEKWRIGTVGKPLKGVEVRIAEDGEVLVRGPSVMKGYWNLPELTRQTIVEGWLHTGDRGYIDEEGFLVISGRKKDLIITSAGKNITPHKIESLLREDPCIKEAVLYGDRRPHLVALIVPDTEKVKEALKGGGIEGGLSGCVTEGPLYEFFERRIRQRLYGLSRFEQIHRFALIPDDLSCERGELTPTMKLKRDALAKRYAKLIDSLY